LQFAIIYNLVMKILVLAAGKSSRFNGFGSKVLVDFWGSRVIDILTKQVSCVSDFYVLLNEENYDQVELPENGTKLKQNTSAYGTGAAVIQAIEQGSINDDLLIIPADLPLLDSDILRKFMDTDSHVLVGVMDNIKGPEQYGRIVQDSSGKVLKIAEYKVHSEKTPLVNSGIIYISKKAQKLIKNIKLNEQDEFYLTDIVQIANDEGMQVEVQKLDADIVSGFNTVQELNSVLGLAQKKWRKKALSSGAVFQDIDSVYFSWDTKIEEGVIVEPNCKFGPGVHIKKGSIIKAFSVLNDCKVSGSIGPFAHIRSGIVEEEAQIGAFVELSKSHIGKKTKAKHLAYIGNAEVGENVNIGAGVIFCNYDGKKKQSAKIEDNVFVGANSCLISPITVKKGAFLAAGGAFNKNIDEDELSICRLPQKNIPKRLAIEPEKK